MKKQVVFFTVALIAALGAAAQLPQFTVSRDSAGFLLNQPGAAPTRFDTTFVAQTLREKAQFELELRHEAEQLERLVTIRKSLALLADEKKVLSEILKQAEKCGSPK